MTVQDAAEIMEGRTAERQTGWLCGFLYPRADAGGRAWLRAAKGLNIEGGRRAREAYHPIAAERLRFSSREAGGV